MLTTPNISEKGFEVGQPFVQGGHTVVQGGQPFVQGGQPFVHSRVSSTASYIFFQHVKYGIFHKLTPENYPNTEA